MLLLLLLFGRRVGCLVACCLVVWWCWDVGRLVVVWCSGRLVVWSFGVFWSFVWVGRVIGSAASRAPARDDAAAGATTTAAKQTSRAGFPF